ENKFEKIASIKELLNKPINLQLDENFINGVISNDSISFVSSLAEASGEDDCEYKANIVMDISAPEKSDLGKKLAESLLLGIHGLEFSRSHLENYFQANFGGHIYPRLEDVALGYRTIDEVSNILQLGNQAYLVDLAIQLRTSPSVDFIMKKGGEAAVRLRGIFLLLLDFDPQSALGVARDRPHFRE
ncbi:MAG: hypothetical protein H7235_02525, partial [Bdellovibrionaceae bacterium]|nr:hypothetical protein [Pseudobdellovibrionaceae bacterium]